MKASPQESPDDKGLTPLDTVKKSLGLPYKPGEILDVGTPSALYGELQNDDLELKQALLKIEKMLGRKVRIAYNPGCGERVSLAITFPEARTIFVDSSGDVAHAFTQHTIDASKQRFEFYQGDMHSFELPDGIMSDMTLILNAGHMPQTELDKVVATDGLVIINDWHDGASFMYSECPGYQALEKVDIGHPMDDLHVFRRRTA